MTRRTHIKLSSWHTYSRWKDISIPMGQCFRLPMKNREHFVCGIAISTPISLENPKIIPSISLFSSSSISSTPSPRSSYWTAGNIKNVCLFQSKWLWRSQPEMKLHRRYSIYLNLSSLHCARFVPTDWLFQNMCTKQTGVRAQLLSFRLSPVLFSQGASSVVQYFSANHLSRLNFKMKPMFVSLSASRFTTFRSYFLIYFNWLYFE